MRIWAVQFYHPLCSSHRGHREGYSFPLPGDDGKGKTTADRWQIGGHAKLTARRAETFVGQSSPDPAKKTTSLCTPCLCGEYIFGTAPDHV